MESATYGFTLLLFVLWNKLARYGFTMLVMSEYKIIRSTFHGFLCLLLVWQEIFASC